MSSPKRNNYPKLFRWAFAKYVNDCHLREALSFEIVTVRFAHRIFILGKIFLGDILMQTLFLTGEWAVGTFWAFVPAIIAIALALITKQVYLSLFAGIFVGAMLLANGNPIHALGTIFEVMSAKIDVGILAFLIVLGIIVILLQKS